jgi:hypothetical protein
MSKLEIFQIIASFFGGGIAVTIINWVRTIISERETRREYYVSQQLEHLYGPLYSYAMECKDLFSRANEIDSITGSQINSGKPLETLPDIERDSNRSFKLIELSSEVIRKYRQNGRNIAEALANIIKQNIYFADNEDHDLFKRVILAANIIKNENDNEGKDLLPYSVKTTLPAMNFMPEELIRLIEEKYFNKKAEQAKYRKKLFKYSPAKIFKNIMRFL